MFNFKAFFIDKRPLHFEYVHIMNEPSGNDPHEHLLKAMNILEKDVQPTQRNLSEYLNLSLGKINFIIKSLIDKGWIKVKRFKNSNHKSAYLYYLTPKGLEQKVVLTRNFLRRKLTEYEKIGQEIEALEADLKREESEYKES